MRLAVAAIVCVALTAGVSVSASSSAITLVVQPRIIGSQTQQLSISGSISNARADDKVTVQFKQCGLNPLQFRDAAETTTNSSGRFSVDSPPIWAPSVSGVFRAVHRGSVSAEVPVWQQAVVTLQPLASGRFEVGVWARVSFWRRYVVLQRRSGGAWKNVRRLLLTEQRAPGSSGTVAFHTEPFRPSVPRGTRIRVVFPLSQAKPCYLAGVSRDRRA